MPPLVLIICIMQDDEESLAYVFNNQEMSSISVISPMMDTIVYQTNSSTKQKHLHCLPVKRARREDWVWTNFHCLLCLGITGFIIFWTFLLLRYVCSRPT